MRRSLVILSACLALAACGSSGVTPGARSSTPAITPTGSASPSPNPTRTGTTMLTEADSGTTVILKVGESILVRLPLDYHQPEAQGVAVRRSAASGGYPTGREATATFTAVAPGNAEVTASTDYECLHATPSCALPQQLWSARVAVF